MKALRIDKHGGPEVLRIAEVPMPQVAPGTVLVKVAAASVNPIDWKMRNGEMRVIFPFPLPRTLGRDFAGRVVEVGDGVTDLKAGDRVFGAGDPMRDGTHAEYVVVQRAMIARTPERLADDVAASVPVAGVSALIPLAETANLQPRQRVLIHAAAGGVGTFAVQIARHLGAEVLATAGPRNVDYVKGLGADRVIDYSAGDFTQEARDCDVVFDTLGGEAHRRSFACLKPGGLLVALSAAPIDGAAPRSDVRVTKPQIQITEPRLAKLAEWAVSGAIRPQIGLRAPFADAERAYRQSESGHSRGKIVLLIA